MNSVPSAAPFDAAPREVVTLYGAVDAQALALALAAAFEGQRVGGDQRRRDPPPRRVGRSAARWATRRGATSAPVS